MFSWLPFLAGCGYEQAFEEAVVDKIEVINIPASTVLQTKASGDYYSKADELFMRLFRYIEENNVSMTTPVEAGINDAEMSFYVGPKDRNRGLKDNADVVVRELPERKVVRIGGGGSYTRENLQAAEKKLVEWLTANRQYSVAGKAYGVFWNSPFTPNFMKRFEIHIPVKGTGGSAAGSK